METNDGAEDSVPEVMADTVSEPEVDTENVAMADVEDSVVAPEDPLVGYVPVTDVDAAGVTLLIVVNADVDSSVVRLFIVVNGDEMVVSAVDKVSGTDGTKKEELPRLEMVAIADVVVSSSQVVLAGSVSEAL